MARAMVASFLVLLLAFPIAFATDYTVGDSGGWTLGGDYTTWASGKTFKVGDNLVFKYDSNHELDEVSESDYSSCSSSSPIKNYQDGNTKIALSATGKRYFLCPKPGHCNGGMKLQVNVVAGSSGSPPPTTPSGSPPKTPSTPSNPSPPESGSSPSTNSSSSPSPKSSGATSVSNGISLLLGSFFVSATMFGFMA